MTNEGIIHSDTAAVMKSEMVRQIQKLGQATPEAWERAVFTAVTGHTREDVDWEVEDNQAGYYTWIKTFDRLVHELVDDGFVKAAEADGVPVMKALEVDPPIGWSASSGPTEEEPTAPAP
ncbi:MAG: hypothetical protein ACYTDY_10000 [Planctomycetota bacterium]|jgi:hypothetical protein